MELALEKPPALLVEAPLSHFATNHPQPHGAQGTCGDLGLCQVLLGRRFLLLLNLLKTLWISIAHFLADASAPLPTPPIHSLI